LVAWRLEVSSHCCHSCVLELECLALAVAEIVFVAAGPWPDLCMYLEAQDGLAVVAALVPWIAVVCRYWQATFEVLDALHRVVETRKPGKDLHWVDRSQV
jgi:hypothetical protein